MSSTYSELQAKINELQRQAAELLRTERAASIAEIKAKMAELGITIEDLSGAAVKTRRSSGIVAAKYRDPQSGKTWTGRGRSPAWLVEAESNGQTRNDFLIG